MANLPIDFLNVDSCLKLWRDRILSSVKRKELSPGELSSLFQNPDLQTAFFRIIDHDNNGNLSQEEWTGSFLKLLGEDNNEMSVTWFIEKFNGLVTEQDSTYLKREDFHRILADSEFGYRFAALISPKSRRISTLQLITSLEIIASTSTDSKWLTWLKYQFTAAMYDSNRLDKNELYVTLDDFTNNFYFKEPFLAQRLFAYLDTEKQGYLSLHKFINGLEVVVNGSQEEKMEFLFKVFDIDNDGKIDLQEMRMMLKCCLEDLPSLDKDETVEELAIALFQDIDVDSSGDISLDELKEAFKRHKSLFKTLTVSTSIWIKPKYTSKNSKYVYFNKLKEKISNNQAYFIFWSAYFAITIACMATAYSNYKDAAPWVIVARMFGNSLNFNCSLILALVLRKHCTWLRVQGANQLIPIDHFIEIHKKLGIIIMVQSVIHTVAHFINLYIVCEKENSNYWDSMFTSVRNLGYPTGVLELILLIIILIFASPIVRKSGHFQLFYCFHLLTIPWLIIMLLHGKKFWIWLLLPGFCYAIEAIMKYRKTRSHNFGDTFINEIIVLPSKVIHLAIKKPPKFHYKPGDYVFINIPMVAKYEWHPFSISSAPERSDYIWLHIRVAGNWTRKLYNYSSSFTMERTRNGSAVDINQMAFRKRGCSIRLGTEMAKLRLNDINKESVLQMEPIGEEECTDHQELPHIGGYEMENNEKHTDKKTSKAIVRFKNSPNIMNNRNETVNETFEHDTQNENTVQDETNEEIAMSQKESEMVGMENESTVQNNNGSNHNSEEKLHRVDTLETTLNLLYSEKNQVQPNQTATRRSTEQYSSNPSICSQQVDKNGNFLRRNSNLSGSMPSVGFEGGDGYNEDELGYLKMYKKANRFCLGTIGVDECWRLKCSIDGPYGTPTQEIFDAEHAVLIAAGIGITPFASVLQSMMNRFNRMNARCKQCHTPIGKSLLFSSEDCIRIRKVDFIWVTRDQRSLEWFISLLSRMEIDQRKSNVNFLETHLYVTSAKRQSDLKTIGLHITLDAIFSQEESSLIDGLRQRTHSGRPNWDIVLQNLIRKKKGKINVFYCGPPNLGHVLEDKCNEYKLQFKKEFF